jgi:hypothetical protein
LNKIGDLNFSSLHVDEVGFIQCQISNKEKDNVMGEFSHWKTVYVSFKEERLEEMVNEFLKNVEQTLDDLKEKWEKAKEIHLKVFPDSNSSGRDKAIEFAKIYQEIISQM